MDGRPQKGKLHLIQVLECREAEAIRAQILSLLLAVWNERVAPRRSPESANTVRDWSLIGRLLPGQLR